MRRLALTAVAIGFALVPASATAQVSPETCAQRGQTIEASDKARVFTNWKGKHPRVYACAYGKRPRLLGRLNQEGFAISDRTLLQEVQLNGQYVTFILQTCARSTGFGCKQRAVTLDLRSGTITREANLSGGAAPVLVTAGDGSFVLGGTGGFAPTKLVAAGPGGTVLLDEGEGLDIWSAAIGVNRTVYWYHGDELRTAPLS